MSRAGAYSYIHMLLLQLLIYIYIYIICALSRVEVRGKEKAVDGFSQSSYQNTQPGQLRISLSLSRFNRELSTVDSTVKDTGVEVIVIVLSLYARGPGMSSIFFWTFC